MVTGVNKLRFRRLKAMHEFMLNANDENVYMSWINYVPDEANDDDFEYIACDKELYSEVCDLFRKLVANGEWD